VGNRIHYTLDVAGNRLKEETFDSTNTLKRTVSRTYNTLSQLLTVVDAFNRTILSYNYSDGYDAAGNPVHSSDAVGIQRKRGYDALHRLVSTIDNYNGTDTATKDTQSVSSYDASDHLEGMGDPDGLNTIYSYNGLDDLKSVQSPDTGTTSYIYDAAGNITQRTDAKGVTSTSTYDALNRRTATTYSDTSLNVAYLYDEPNGTTGCASSYPIGRLTRIVESAVTTTYCYDARGNVLQKRQTQGSQVDTISYSYSLAGRLDSMLTPSGTSVQYARDVVGRISGVTVLPPGVAGAGAGNVVTNITYLPFGPITGYTLGNGQTVAFRTRAVRQVSRTNFWSTSMANGWTPERRARQAEAIRRWKPWERSTGPRTEGGKGVVSRNAWTGGRRHTLRALARAMKVHKNWIASLF